ncbi:MAG: DUF4349 domain-containing protein [Kofleriaceae bacterium]|nr:DUF4349 domain-containing protein [Kofleriaceae bacterium]
MPRIASVLLAYTVLGSTACGAGYAPRYAKSAAPPMVASAAQTGAPSGNAPGAVSDSMAIPEALVIEGSLSVEVSEINDIVPTLRATVEGIGGRVVNEAVSGAETSWSAHLKLRLPPEKVELVVAFLAGRGDITSKNVTATDVSKQLFDQALAIKNLRTTLDRLTVLMGSPGLQVAQILEIEKEMTRIRGQIDQLEGDQRFLKDRVAYATLDVSITRRDGAVVFDRPEAKFYPGVRATSLTLFDPGNRRRTRFGAGLVMHSFLRSFSLEVDVFQKEYNEAHTEQSTSVIATLGGAAYSDFLGGGKRRTLNPYIGMRVGYAYLDTSRFALQAEAGVELFKHKYLVIDASARATSMFGKDFDLGLVAGAGAIVSF